jgi:hypothetical protein
MGARTQAEGLDAVRAARPLGWGCSMSAYRYLRSLFVEITELFPLTVTNRRFRGTLRNKCFFTASVTKAGVRNHA